MKNNQLKTWRNNTINMSECTSECGLTAVSGWISLSFNCYSVILRCIQVPTPDGSAASVVGLFCLTSQHRVLVLGCADQPADTINYLALRVQLFLLRLLAEKNHCKRKWAVSWVIKKNPFSSIWRSRGELLHMMIQFSWKLKTRLGVGGHLPLPAGVSGKWR